MSRIKIGDVCGGVCSTGVCSGVIIPEASPASQLLPLHVALVAWSCLHDENSVSEEL